MEMKKIIALCCASAFIFLAGCSHTPIKENPPEVVVKIVYVIPQFSGELVALPPNVPPLNLETATQREVSIWLADNEKRIAALERRILAMANLSAVLVKRGNIPEENIKILDINSEEDLKTE